jgi:hypothetical protein
LNIAKQRRQSGKMETQADLSEQPLLIDGEGAEVLEIAMAVVGGE